MKKVTMEEIKLIDYVIPSGWIISRQYPFWFLMVIFIISTLFFNFYFLLLIYFWSS